MPITSFQKMLLRVGAGAAVVGGGVTVGVLRSQRIEREEADYRATPVTLDDFVTRTIDAFDRGTYGDPLVPVTEKMQDLRDTPDGRLNIGVEDIVRGDKAFFREIVDVAAADYYEAISGRAFLRAADADTDGVVTRAELTAAVKPHAGSDGKLDEAERRAVIKEHGLGTIVDSDRQPDIAGWGNGSNGVKTAATAAGELMHALDPMQTYRDVKDDGQPAIRIADLKPRIPWGNHQDPKLASGDIWSRTPALAAIDQAGNGNGLLSQVELATWIAKEFRDPKLLDGHVDASYDELLKGVERQRLGRIEADSLAGHAFYDAKVPAADVERFYGGDVRAWLDGQKGFRAARGDAEWEPDPRSGSALEPEGR